MDRSDFNLTAAEIARVGKCADRPSVMISDSVRASSLLINLHGFDAIVEAANSAS
jgi:hypothetical protein